jgi:imidazolonepropionase-like amidohydrolase
LPVDLSISTPVTLDLSHATVLPGLIDAHTHMFNSRKPDGTTEDYTLIAVQNAQLDLQAGFTAARDMTSHGNGYGDICDSKCD